MKTASGLRLLRWSGSSERRTFCERQERHGQGGGRPCGTPDLCGMCLLGKMGPSDVVSKTLIIFVAGETVCSTGLLLHCRDLHTT